MARARGSRSIHPDTFALGRQQILGRPANPVKAELLASAAVLAISRRYQGIDDALVQATSVLHHASLIDLDPIPSH
jgi:hypothetical protein